MWNVVAVGGGLEYGAEGQPLANSHYGYHMVSHCVERPLCLFLIVCAWRAGDVAYSVRAQRPALGRPLGISYIQPKTFRAVLVAGVCAR